MNPGTARSRACVHGFGGLIGGICTCTTIGGWAGAGAGCAQAETLRTVRRENDRRIAVVDDETGSGFVV